MKRVFSLIILLFTVSIGLNAKDINIRIEAPNYVSLNEQFKVTFIVEGDRPDDLSWDCGDNFKIVFGPSVGTNSSITILNGKTTSSKFYTYTYYLISQKVGKFNLNPAVIKFDKKYIKKSNSIDIEVVNDRDTANQDISNSNSQSSKIFLKMKVDKANVYLGQPIVASLDLYSQAKIADMGSIVSPSLIGFWNKVIDTGNTINFDRTKYDNEIYDFSNIRNWVLIPQQAGDLKVDPASLDVLITYQDPNLSFDNFFDDGYSTIKKSLKSKPITIHVKNLPVPQPLNFSGGVGKFTINSYVQKSSLKMNEANSLIIQIKGEGNISLLDAPKVNFPSGFDVYDVKSSVNILNNGLSGTRTFELPFIPRSSGEFQIPPVEFIYFNTYTSKYETIKSEPITLNVEYVKDNDSSKLISSSSNLIDKQNVKSYSKDIRYINVDKPKFIYKKYFLISSLFYYAFGVFVFVLISLLAFYLKYNEKQKSNVQGMKFKGASKMAQKRLKRAKQYLDAQSKYQFYEEVYKVIFTFLSDKFAIGYDQLNKENIVEILSSNGASKDIVDSLIKLLDNCELARFAPNANIESMHEDYNLVISLISQIDSIMKRKPKAFIISLILILGLGGSLNLNAQNADSLWQAGITSYQNQEWSSAIDSWQKLYNNGVISSTLDYNLANAYFRDNQISKAILFWEKSLKLDPSNADAKYNLAFAQNYVKDKIDVVPEFIFKTAILKIANILSSNAWAIIAMISFILFLICILLLMRRNAKNKGFYLGFCIFVALIMIFTISLSVIQKDRFLSKEYAIIMNNGCQVKGAPSGSNLLFILHEGTKVKVIEEVGNWYNIRLQDGRQGWIEVKDVEII